MTQPRPTSLNNGEFAMTQQPNPLNQTPDKVWDAIASLPLPQKKEIRLRHSLIVMKHDGCSIQMNLVKEAVTASNPDDWSYSTEITSYPEFSFTVLNSDGTLKIYIQTSFN